MHRHIHPIAEASRSGGFAGSKYETNFLAGSSMAVEWFCRVMGSDVGPLSQDQLVDMARQRHLNPEDLVRRGNSAWVPAFEVKGLFEAAAKPAPAAPPPPPEPVVEPTIKADQKTPPEPELSRPAKKTEPMRDHVRYDTDGDDWFCIASGEKKGPLGFEQLRALVAAGRLRGRDRVWRGSWPKFRKAAEVEGLEATG